MEKTDQRVNPYKTAKLKRLLFGILPLAAFLAFCVPARAEESLSIISDDETEILLKKITAPIYKAAAVKLNPGHIHIVNDGSLNAFVGDGNHLFINSGTIISADSADELAGVIAHETGHIQGGHILRMKLKNRQLSEATLASTILAGAAIAATGRADVAMAVLLGSQTSALTNMTAYQKQEERSADEAGVSLLKKSGQSPQGMLQFMKKIDKQNRFNGIQETPYFRTHPVTAERISFIQNAVKESPYQPDSRYDAELARVKAKLIAFLMPPAETRRRYPAADTSTAARYARAIADFKQLKMPSALRQMEALIKEEPDNPFFHELLAQMNLETGKVKEAKRHYQKALSLLPASPLLQVSLAQAILEDNPGSAELRQAVTLLNKSLVKRPMAFSWLLLSRAYGQLNETAYANYAAAEYSYYIGAFDVAEQQALAAKKALRNNPRLKLKIDDLLARRGAPSRGGIS